MLRSWLRRLDSLGVEFRLGHRWTGWNDDGLLRFESSAGPVEVSADRTVLALGGASWPRVSSDGSWQALLAERGVSVKELRPANCGLDVAWSKLMADRFAGEPIKNAAVIVDGVTVRGDPIVTSNGLEGGPIYAHSRRIREQLDAGPTDLSIDLMPDLDFEALEARLSVRQAQGQTVAKWFRRCGISAVGASLMREARNNDLPKDAAEIAELAKAVPVAVTALATIDRAISSAGGVAWSELGDDFQLHDLSGVYVVGEMLDWEAPTGGYLLQACFSTAYAAAKACIDSAE